MAKNSGDAKAVIGEMEGACLLMRSRLISRVVTAIHDEALQPHGIGAAQFVLLVVIGSLGPSSRAEIARYHKQDRSTLSRNLKVILAEGWVDETVSRAKGRARPIALTDKGRALLIGAAPAWRKAQARVKTLVGTSGAAAITEIADRMLEGDEID